MVGVGLGYIETQRKIYLEFAEEERRKAVYRAPLFAIYATLFVGTLAVASNMYVGWLSAHATGESNRLKAEELVVRNREMDSKQPKIVRPSLPVPTSPPASGEGPTQDSVPPPTKHP